MNIILKRYHQRDYAIAGTLSIAEQKICDTAENAHSCIPTGTHRVVIHTCKHYRRKMPVILIVPDSDVKECCADCPRTTCVSNNAVIPRYCPQIKIGNGVCKRTDGSIIIGERIVTGCIKHPVEYFNRLIDRLDKAQQRGEEITLTVIESKPFKHS